MNSSESPLNPPPAPPLIPPGRNPRGHGPDGPKGKRGPILTVAGLLFLCVLAVAVAYWLPGVTRRAENRHNTGRAESIPAGTEAVNRAAEQVAEQKQGQESSLVDRQKALAAERIWLERKARAELENMHLWGGKDYARALELSETALKQFKEKRFSSATAYFTRASSLIDSLEASRQELLEQAIEEGIQALEQGLQKEAAKAFSMALAIDPSNSKARAGLKRSETIVKVHELLKRASGQLEAGRSESALKTAEGIIRIDPLCTRARRLLEQARHDVKRKRFDAEMGRAISALAKGRYMEAQNALEHARSLFPADQAVSELWTKIETARTASALHTLLNQAERAQKAEQWTRALALYKRALAIDPLSVAAQNGTSRCLRMRALEASLEKIIKDPWNLNQQGPLNDAKNIVKMAQTVDSPGPVLKKLTVQAQEVLRKWQQKVKVTLTSDNMTDVVIYHVGRLGRFRKRTIKLRPGIYTVKGRRQGYRDVLKHVRISPESGKVQVEVRCTEAI